jgi:hypothetical protein
MKAASEIMTFYKQWRGVYSGLKPCAKTGLVLPHTSQRSNASEFALSLSEYKGLYKSLQELHIPFDVIGQQNIADISENGGFERYDLVILPDLGSLKPEDASILDDWASTGGTLLATGEVGVNDDGSLQLKSLPAERRIEFLNDGKDLWSMYFAPEQNRTEEHYYKGPIIPLLGTYSLYEWKNGSRGRYKKLGYAPFAPPEYIYGNVQVDERGVGIGSSDNGTGVLVPFPVGRGYREIGLSIFRDFFELTLDEVNAKDSEILQIDVASQVEATLMTDGKRVVVHLINMSGIRGENFGQYLPIPAGSIKVSGGLEGVTARSLRGNMTLELEDDTIKLPGLDLFDVVVIEGLGQS